VELPGVDWREGWAGNFTAELVGVVLSLLVAYVVADRVVQWRLRQERRPLRQRLASRLKSELRMISVSWAFRLGTWKPGDVANDSVDLEAPVEAELTRYRSPEEMQELIGRVELDHPRGLAQLAQEIADDIRGVTRAADRYANIIEDDPTLLGLIGDLEEVGANLESTLKETRSLERVGAADAGRLGLVTFCLIAFNHAREMRAHLADSL